ncbi:hypothetical protein SAY86_013161 [Trapa natans]|uniref:BZIP domain-containing protein n=1 Tax=Trapa natans TaxID=22666 RepID=A0AAN7R9V4_TRANT|nr:hypothetical protein SAY86_013161 [Trapa natans]
MGPNWPALNPHGRFLPPPIAQSPLWVNEFLDFSSARRAAHRRSASDSITFLESPAVVYDDSHQHEFEKFDDEQFMSMFTEEKPGGLGLGSILSSNDGGPLSPASDHNSMNDQKQLSSPPYADQTHHQQPTGDDQNDEEGTPTPCNSEAPAAAAAAENSSDRIVDPKRVKRILANRQSAQRSRVRKLQYISDLERSVTSLQAEVLALSPRVAFLDHQRLLLNVDNSALKQRIAALSQDNIFKDAHQDALKREIDRLRQVYQQQQQQQENSNKDTESNADPKSPPPQL